MCLGGHCNVDPGRRIGLFKKMTFEQFEREGRSRLGGLLGEEHSRHSDSEGYKTLMQECAWRVQGTAGSSVAVVG